MPAAQFANPLEASSYFHPTANSAYALLREKRVEAAIQMGYDYDSLTEIGIDWSSDQDPNNHVTNPAYPRYASAGNMRLFESFAGVMGDKYSAMLKGRGIGPVFVRRRDWCRIGADNQLLGTLEGIKSTGSVNIAGAGKDFGG